MNPLVYMDESQVRALRARVGPQRSWFRGVAFEWRGEGVFHLHARRPVVAPSGYPLGGCIAFFPAGADLDAAAPVVWRQARAGFGSARWPCRRAVLALFQERDGGLQARAFLAQGDRLFPGELELIPTRSDLYSRSRGLLEVDVLERRRVAIVGLGSFGSTIALELAKAGVGHFDLFDFDRLELANLARHTGRLQDLGRHKTRVVRDTLLSKNPWCDVQTWEVDVNQHLDLLRERVAASDLVIGVTDNQASRLNVNQVAVETGRPVLFGRAITRAAGGDVLRVRPGEGPCLNCLFGQGLLQAPAEVSTLRQARRESPAYTTPGQLQAAVQVGLASDIAPITNLIVKLALVSLSAGTASGIESVGEDLTADFYIWANRRDLIYRDWPRMGCSFDRNSILRWYGTRVPRDPDCLVCGPLAELTPATS